MTDYYDEPRFSLNDIFRAYEKLTEQERAWCAGFCAENSGDANDRRERERDLIVSGVFRMKLDLEMLNDRRRKTA